MAFDQVAQSRGTGLAVNLRRDIKIHELVELEARGFREAVEIAHLNRLLCFFGGRVFGLGFFRCGSHNLIGKSDGSTGFTHGASGNLVGFDIRVNGTQLWATDGSDDAYDLQAAIVHEVGHALGIEHSEVEDATMFASIGHGGLTRRQTHDDDEDAALFLYTRDAEPPPASDQPLALSCATTGSPAMFGWIALLFVRRRT